MKRSKLSKLAKLVKGAVENEKQWGEMEVIPFAVKKPATAVKSKTVNEPKATYNASPNAALAKIHANIAVCKDCALGKSRLNAVPGDGNHNAKLMFIGEGPGFEEDHKGLPFIGRAGQLLTRIIEAIDLKREDVFITNIVKCHPMIDPSDPEKHGNDRPPTPEEMAACVGYLNSQIEAIKPKCICILGGSAAKTLLKTEVGISKLRGVWCEYNGHKVMPTYHPAALLRSPSLKKDTWEDMKQIRDHLNSK